MIITYNTITILDETKTLEEIFTVFKRLKCKQEENILYTNLTNMPSNELEVLEEYKKYLTFIAIKVGSRDIDIEKLYQHKIVQLSMELNTIDLSVKFYIDKNLITDYKSYILDYTPNKYHSSIKATNENLKKLLINHNTLTTFIHNYYSTAIMVTLEDNEIYKNLSYFDRKIVIGGLAKSTYTTSKIWHFNTIESNELIELNEALIPLPINVSINIYSSKIITMDYFTKYKNDFIDGTEYAKLFVYFEKDVLLELFDSCYKKEKLYFSDLTNIVLNKNNNYVDYYLTYLINNLKFVKSRELCYIKDIINSNGDNYIEVYEKYKKIKSILTKLLYHTRKISIDDMKRLYTRYFNIYPLSVDQFDIKPINKQIILKSFTKEFINTNIYKLETSSLQVDELVNVVQQDNKYSLSIKYRLMLLIGGITDEEFNNEYSKSLDVIRKIYFQGLNFTRTMKLDYLIAINPTRYKVLKEAVKEKICALNLMHIKKIYETGKNPDIDKDTIEYKLYLLLMELKDDSNYDNHKIKELIVQKYI